MLTSSVGYERKDGARSPEPLDGVSGLRETLVKSRQPDC